jgi:hypothetical protein
MDWVYFLFLQKLCFDIFLYLSIFYYIQFIWEDPFNSEFLILYYLSFFFAILSFLAYFLVHCLAFGHES